jgi:tRNA (guanine10-N2)-methyltransferase
MREYIFWYAAGDHKHFGRFRHEELKALLQLVVGTDHGLVTSTRDEDLPYAIVRLESEEQARAVALRSVLTYGVFELWEHAESLEELSKRIDSFDIHGKENFFSKNTSFCARVRAFGKRFAHKEILEIIESVCSKLPFQGNVNLEDPDVQLWILLDYGHRDKESDLKKCFLTRKICKSAREHLLSKYALQKRLYLGTTSTKAELAFAMANQVHARPGSLILDPFAGTASILVACRAVGAFVFGADIDFRVLYGTTEPGKSSDLIAC